MGLDHLATRPAADPDQLSIGLRRPRRILCVFPRYARSFGNIA